MVARTGEFRHHIQFQAYTSSRGAEGSFNKSWANQEKRWAKVNPVSGQERIQADQTKNVITHRVTCRYYADINTTWRFIWNSRTFHILNVVDVGSRGCYTVLDVQEVGDNS